MRFGINPEFLELKALVGNKKEGIPLVHYDSINNYLTALIGEGDCRRYVSASVIIPGVSELLKRDKETDELDGFAGIEVRRGIQGFISKHYYDACGGGWKYKFFKLAHNLNKTEIPFSEIMTLLFDDSPKTTHAEEHRLHISGILRKQNLKVHIPLVAIKDNQRPSV
jgi:hypothetical protein